MTANGTFGDSTTQAVKRWQKKLGVPETGTVALGELIAVAQLPSRLLLDADVIAPGVVLAGGEKAVLGAVGDPAFVLPLSDILELGASGAIQKQLAKPPVVGGSGAFADGIQAGGLTPEQRKALEDKLAAGVGQAVQPAGDPSLAAAATGPVLGYGDEAIARVHAEAA